MEEREYLKIPDVVTGVSTAVDRHKHPGVHRGCPYCVDGRVLIWPLGLN
jgi:hypothetical protein